MERVLAILIDALRYDYVNESDTPFIHGLAKQGHKLPLRPVLGYSDAIRATIFTGAYPDRHGYWMSYCYSPETSPFKVFRALQFVDLIPSDLIRRGLKFLLSSTLCKLLAKTIGYHRLHLHNIPFSIIDRFDATLRKSMLAENPFSEYPTIFDVLRENRIRFAYFDSSILRRRLLAEIAKLNPETKFVMVYLHYIDEVSHRFGLRSQRFKRALRSVDAIARCIVRLVARVWGEEPFVIVFSDHGMVEEKGRIDLSHLTKLDGFGNDFMFVLDATMMRVWYFNAKARERVKLAIERIGHCRQLTNEQKRVLKIEFRGNGYGDEIFLFDPGYIIFPNFYSYIRPKAMHSYDPEHPTQQGIFIICGDNCPGQVQEGAVELVDITPSILSLLAVSTPPTCEGKSLTCSSKYIPLIMHVGSLHPKLSLRELRHV